MATWEEILNPITENRINATRPQPRTPAVVRRRDVFNTAYKNVERSGAVSSPGGWKGLVSDVLGSPVGGALTKVGEVVSIPGRAVVSGVQEAVDIFDNDPNTKASWDDFTRQVADPSFGFGTVIGDITGSKWTNRMLGFAGDVLLDPTTYLSLGSTKALKVLDEAGDVATGMRGLSVASAEGRLSLANRVLERTGDKALATNVARYGRAAIKDPTVFERIGLDRAGLYFMGKRLPGSTRVGEAVERGFASMRTWSGDHMFKRANELFTLNDAKAARRQLLRGTATPDQGADYLNMVLSMNAQRAAKGAAAREAGSSLTSIVDRYGAPQFVNMGKSARRAIETGTIDELDGIAQGIAREADEWFKGLWARTEEATRAVDPQAPLGRIENYVPMIASDKALKDMARGYNPRFTELKEFVYNPLDPAGSFKHRMGVDDDFFGYKLTADDVNNIDRMNEIAREYGKIDYDFFETDLLSIMSKYVDQFSDQLGIVARKKHLVDTGVFQKLEPTYYIDEDAWKSVRKRVNKATKERTAAAKNASQTLDNLVKQIDSTLKSAKDNVRVSAGTKKVVDDKGKMVSKLPGVTLEQADAAAKWALTNSSNAQQAKHLARVALRDAYSALEAQRGTLAAIVGERPPQVVQVLENRLETVLQKIQTMSDDIENLTDNGVQFANGKLRMLQQEIADIEQKEALLEEFGNLVESKLDDIIDGKEVTGVEKIADAIRGTMVISGTTPGGRRALISGSFKPADESKPLWDRLRNTIKFGKEGGAPGKWSQEKEAILRQRFAELGGTGVSKPGVVGTDWWKNSNIAAEITPTAVADMTPEKVADVVTKAMRGEASIREMRTAILSIASNDIEHPRDLWMSVFGDGSDGSGVMARAAQAEQFFTSLAKLGQNRNRFTRLMTLKSDTDKVLDSVASDLSSYASATGLLKRIFNVTFDENMVVPPSMLREYLQQPEFATLRDTFSRFIDEPADDITTEAWSVARNIDPEDVMGMGFVKGGGVVSDANVDFTSASGLRSVETSLPELTFGEMARILRSIVDNVDNRGAEHFITFTPTGAAKNLRQGAAVPTERTLRVNAADYSDEIYYMIENGEEWPSISARIEEIVYGKQPKETGPRVVKGVTRVQRVRGGDQALWGEAGDPLVGIRGEAKKIADELKSDFAGFVDVDSVKTFNVNGDISSVSFITDIGGKKKTLSKQAAEEAQRELSNVMLEFWFRSEVSARFKKAIDLFQPFGVVPTIDYQRRIANQVAKRAGIEVSSDLENLSSALTTLDGLIDSIKTNRSGWVGREKELYDTISRSIGDYGDIMARYGGRADAASIRKQWVLLGGNRPAGTGLPKKINAARRMASNPAATAEQRLEAQNFLNASRSLDAIAEERDKFYDNVVKKWYESNYGYPPANRTEADVALREMANISNGYGRLGEAEPYQQQLKWLETVRNGLVNAQRDIRNNKLWIVQASDPFLDYSKLRIGTSRGRQDLPSMYSAALRSYAVDYDKRAAELATETERAFAVSSELAKARGPQAAAERARQAMGRPRASLEEAAQMTGIEQKNLERARVAHLRATEMRSSLDYVAAIEREELNDLLNDMALFNLREDTPIPRYVSVVNNAKALIESGQEVFVRNDVAGQRGFKQVKNVGQLVDNEVYYTFVPSEGFQTVRSLNRVDDRIKGLRKRVASLQKEVDTSSNTLDSWYSFEKKNLDPRDLDAKRDLDAELKARRQDIATKKSEIESTKQVIGELQLIYERSWRQVEPTYRGNIFYKEETIKFTKPEYESLFMTPQEFSGRSGVVARRINDVDRAVAAERNLINEIDQMISAQTKIARETGSMLRNANMASRRNLLAKKAEAEARIDLLIEKKNTVFIPESQKFLPSVRQSALEKARILNQKIKDGEFSREELLEGLRRRGGGAESQVVDARIKALKTEWEQSTDKKFLDSYRTIENSIQYELASGAIDTFESLIRYADTLRAQADEVWGMYADDSAPWGFVEKAGEKQARTAPVVGVAGIHRRLSETDTDLRNALSGLSKATGNQINAVERFDNLMSSGMKSREAIDQIVSEAKALRPDNAVFMRASELAQLASRRQDLVAEVGFWQSFGRDAAARLYGGKGSFKDLNRQKFDLVQQAKRLQAEIDKYMPDWAKSQRELIDTQIKNLRESEKALANAELQYTNAAKVFDQAQISKMNIDKWYPAVVAPLREQRSKIVNRLDELTKIMSKEANSDFKIAQVLNWLDEVDSEIFDFVGVENYDAIKRLQADALVAQERLITLGDSMRFDLPSSLENLEWGTNVEYQARKGWESLKGIGLPSFQARREIAEMVTNFSRLQEPAFVRSLNKFIGSYTGFFKAYATATPGFIVRNTLGNTFSIVAAGASPKAMADGLGVFREWRQALKSNSVDTWLSSMKPARRQMVELAIKSTDASGYGRVGEAFSMWRPNRKWLVDNRYIGAFRSANSVAEDSARFILAWDSVARGADFDTAVARVKRYLFDYQNVSTGDEVLRSIIPFWFWMSRNLPLQLTNQWMNPKAYVIYKNFTEAIASDEEEDPLLPSWMREQGAVRLGGDTYLSMDLGFNRVQEQLKELGEPSRLMSYVNPALRLPVELMGGRKLYSNVPFSDRGQTAMGGPVSGAVQALAELLGQSAVTPEGQLGVSDKFNYALRNLVPPLAQAERLVPSTEYGQQAQLSSILGYLGVPLREVTPMMREAESRRQLRKQQGGQ